MKFIKIISRRPHQNKVVKETSYGTRKKDLVNTESTSTEEELSEDELMELLENSCLVGVIGDLRREPCDTVSNLEKEDE